MCERASVCTPLSVWWASVCVSFLVILRGCRKGRFFSSSLQRLLVSTKRERSSHGPSPRIQQARSFDTKLTGSFINKEKQKRRKKWPKSNRLHLTEKQKQSVTNIPTSRTWKRAWDLREEPECKEFVGMRSELWGGQPCNRVNLGKKKKTNFSSTYIMLSTNINPELMKRSWSKSSWFWDSLKGINPCLVEIKRSLFLSSEQSSSN